MIKNIFCSASLVPIKATSFLEWKPSFLNWNGHVQVSWIGTQPIKPQLMQQSEHMRYFKQVACDNN